MQGQLQQAANLLLNRCLAPNPGKGELQTMRIPEAFQRAQRASGATSLRTSPCTLTLRWGHVWLERRMYTCQHSRPIRQQMPRRATPPNWCWLSLFAVNIPLPLTHRPQGQGPRSETRSGCRKPPHHTALLSPACAPALEFSLHTATSRAECFLTALSRLATQLLFVRTSPRP